MKKILCCFKGKNENDGLDEARPFGNNEFLNNVMRLNIEIPDDRYPPNSNPDDPLIAHCGVTFPWHEILDGTENFSVRNFLGKGNFGEVYRCDFLGIDKVGAAKIQDPSNPFAQNEFVAEITTLHAANHPNVIKLLGKYSSHENRVIVYEYMPKRSLDQHIYAHKRPASPGLPQVLNWETRMKIAEGVAEALVYLHDELKVIHRDVKLSNVLLDENLVPKLTDFGLATKMVIDRVEQQSVINPAKGTRGCIAPETEESGLVSSKSDVYSYGVFLLTLFTGLKAYVLERPFGTWKLTDWLMPVWSRKENIPLVVDVALGPRYSVDGLDKLFEAATLCTKLQARDRPPMKVVLSMVRLAAAEPLREFLPVTRSRSR